jgi:hemerythrin-like domain-containing protein
MHASRRGSSAGGIAVFLPMAIRHPALVPLAREHHDALLLAVRLQQGRRALLRLWSHDPTVQAKILAGFYRSKLLRHFRAEENILFPLIDAHLRSLHALAETLRSDHLWFHAQVETIESAGSADLISLLSAFGKRLESHIRTEDRELFCEFERDASEEVLSQLQHAMDKFYGSTTDCSL